MCTSQIDQYDVSPPSAWWEMECVRYGLSYVPVRSRLTILMGNHVVRLTDRNYMIRLASKSQEDYETRQKHRIEQKVLKLPSIVPKMSTMHEPLLRKIPRRRRRQCAPKLHAEAIKMCKQLPQLILTDESQLQKHL